MLYDQKDVDWYGWDYLKNTRRTSTSRAKIREVRISHGKLTAHLTFILPVISLFSFILWSSFCSFSLLIISFFRFPTRRESWFLCVVFVSLRMLFGIKRTSGWDISVQQISIKLSQVSLFRDITWKEENMSLLLLYPSIVKCAHSLSLTSKIVSHKRQLVHKTGLQVGV